MNDTYCDRCGAAGKSRWIFPNGNDLVFCGHHTYKYQTLLTNAIEDPAFNQDTTELLGV